MFSLKYASHREDTLSGWRVFWDYFVHTDATCTWLMSHIQAKLRNSIFKHNHNDQISWQWFIFHQNLDSKPEAAWLQRLPSSCRRRVGVRPLSLHSLKLSSQGIKEWIFPNNLLSVWQACDNVQKYVFRNGEINHMCPKSLADNFENMLAHIERDAANYEHEHESFKQHYLGP